MEKTGDTMMALTRNFNETIQTRVQRDPQFREELFREGIQSLLVGDIETGKAILRDYIHAAIGFEALARLTERSARSLMRMFSPKSNPPAKNLFEILEHLQKKEGVQLQVHTVRHKQHPSLHVGRRTPRLASKREESAKANSRTPLSEGNRVGTCSPSP